MANGYGIGGFASGLAEGLRTGQETRARQEALRLAREDREDRGAYKAALEGLGDVNSSGTVGPEGNLVSQNGYDTLQSAYNRVNSILDPKRREQYLQAYAQKVGSIAARPLQDAAMALQAGDTERAMAALQPINTLTGGNSMFSFSLNDKGKVVNGSGTEVNGAHLMGALEFLKQNPSGALQAIFQGDEAARSAANEDRKLADAENRTRAMDDYYKALNAHYERADAVDLLAELNDQLAATGQSGLKPADIKRVDDMMERTLDKGSFASLWTKDPLLYGGLAKQIAHLNGVASGNMTPDEAARNAAVLYWGISGDRISEDDLADLEDEFGEDFKPESFSLQPMDNGTVAVQLENGQGFFVPESYVRPYMEQRAAQRAEQAKHQGPPTPAPTWEPTPPDPSGGRRREQRGRSAIDINEWARSMTEDIKPGTVRNRRRP